MIKDTIQRVMGAKLTKKEVEVLAEEIDILLDPSIGNGIYAGIQHEVLGYEINKLVIARKNIEEGFL